MRTGFIVKLVIALLFFVALMPRACAQVVFPHRRAVSVVTASDPCSSAPYLLQQYFETPTTGYDHCQSWTEGGNLAAIDPDYTGVVLQGTQSLRIFPTATTATTTYLGYTTTDEVWVFHLFRPVSIQAGAFNKIGALRGPADQAICTWYIRNTGVLYIESGAASAQTVTTVSAGTTYGVWVHSKKGTGANAELSIAFSTDGIEPTSGNNFGSLSNSASTQAHGGINLGISSSTTCDFIYDSLLISNAIIGPR